MILFNCLPKILFLRKIIKNHPSRYRVHRVTQGLEKIFYFCNFYRTYIIFYFLHDFVEVSKNLDSNLIIILLSIEINICKTLKLITKMSKFFACRARIFLHNYFDGPVKLFVYLFLISV